MKRRFFVILLSCTFLLSLVSASGGFDSNANLKNPEKPNEGQRDYTHENAIKPIGQGGYYGGHDTISAEGILIKEKVHSEIDEDGGLDFKNKMVRDAFPSLRTGAHDEDSTRTNLGPFGSPYIGSEPPIGPNGDGNFYQHFYDPDTGKGWAGNNSAVERAMGYMKVIQEEVGCTPGGIGARPPLVRQKVYDSFGRILHLLQDMAHPSHTNNQGHLDAPFEKYVNDHWDEIVSSKEFKDKVTTDLYQGGNYSHYPAYVVEYYLHTLAKKSKSYFTERQLYDYVADDAGNLEKRLNQDRLMKNVNDLIPEAIKFTAGYINAIYDYINNPIADPDCDKPPKQIGPGGDHPDDRFDVSDEFYWEKEFGLTDVDLTNLFLRTAVKKGKIGVWYKKQFVETFFKGRAEYGDATAEEKAALENKFDAVQQKMEQKINELESDWNGAPDIALFTNGFYNASISLMLKIGEPVSFQEVNFNPEILKDHPVLLVPTGGLYGLKNSASVKATIEDYVKNGGTLVVFTQQHGYDWSLLPTPPDPETGQGKPITGYGYQEDQSCQFNSVHIDTYHPILSSFSTTTANIGVDGYFTSYPENSTILLRRTANGQPAMILYPYGKGYVIATTVYTDFASAHHQANQAEINLAQNIISWAKKPETLVEIKPGEAANLNVNLSNFTDKDATSVRFSILDPGRKVINEQIHNLSVPAGRSVTTRVSYGTSLASTLGIYHFDYTLLNGHGDVIQPQAETDSGRFVVSDPSESPSEASQLNFSVQTDAEHYIFGSTVNFTIVAFNASGIERAVTANYDGNTETLIIPAKGSDSFTYQREITYTYDHWGHYYNGLWVSFYEGSTFLDVASKIYWVYWPHDNVSIQTDKYFYAKGESVRMSCTIVNNTICNWRANAKITVMDIYHAKVFEVTETIHLSPHGSGSAVTDFILPTTSRVGSYAVRVEVWNGNRRVSEGYTTFELLVSQIAVQPNLPSAYTPGTNIIPFKITNIGKVNLSSGSLDIGMIDPEGVTVHSGSHPFNIAVGETKELEIPITISSLKFGNYTLTYSQSDESKAGYPIMLTIPNTVAVDLSFDKPSYRLREMASLALDLTNMGEFLQDNLAISVSIPDANYGETRTISLEKDSNKKVLNYVVLIPETISAGQHDASVTVTLPSGSSVAQNSKLEIPESSFAIRYEGETDIETGDTLSVIIENEGGLDSSYYSSVSLYDATRTETDFNYETGSVIAGGRNILSYTLSDQLGEGDYTLWVDVSDTKTNKNIQRNIPLKISGLKGSLTVKTNKDIYFSSEAIATLSTILNQDRPIVDGTLHLEIGCANPSASPDELGSFRILTNENYLWVERGVLHFPYYFDRRELTLPIVPDQWGSVYVKFEQRGIENAIIEYIALRGSNGTLYSPWHVGLHESTNYTKEARAEDGLTADVTGEDFHADWDNLPSGVSYTLVMVAKEGEGCAVIWEEDRAINQEPKTTENIDIPAGIIGQKGKFYLRGILTNKFGQTMSFSSYPFYIIDSDTVLTFSTDKKKYRPDEPLTITGKVENRAQITAEFLNLKMTSNGQEIYSTEFNLPSGGVYPFTIPTTAGSDGTVALLGTVSQNNVNLIGIDDQYEVAPPYVYIYVGAPEAVGKESFRLDVWIMNSGMVEASVDLKISDHKANLDERRITIPAGEERLLQYSQEITENTVYTVELTGDVIQTLSQAVAYGEAVQITMETEGSIYPEGKFPIPVMIANTGQLDETIEVTYELTTQNSGPTTLIKNYYLPKGANKAETLYFELIEGDYQITANSQSPMANAQAILFVRKENRVEMVLSLGTQTDGLIPVNVSLSNIGFNTIDGNLHCTVFGPDNKEIWNSERTVSKLLTQTSQLLTFPINPSCFQPGNYALKVELLNNSGQSLLIQGSSLAIKTPIFQITQIPGYRVFYPGEEAKFVFRVKNMGNQEGTFELNLKAHDLLNSVQREWIKPGEEKDITFSFMLPEDWQEKDYFASYQLKDPGMQGVEWSKGQIRYHLAGINLEVNASMDKPYYEQGEIAHLNLTIESSNPNSLSLFARVNYSEYESEQPFRLSGSQTIFFDIPLTQITGEKLFYGIYHESGRSIHLNSIYVYKAGEIVTITTDKQVYQPGETVSVVVTGNASGNMTLSAPGGYEETSPFSGQMARSFILPQMMTAGTYFISVELRTQNSELIILSHPIDIAGIQVKVLDCKNDRGRYAPSDLITTDFTIWTNTPMPAILKTWIVDPDGKHTKTGQMSISLSSLENLLVTHQSLLTTGISGVHRLVYGVYSEDLLLISGSEAFDVGDAVLLGLSTDKVDYAVPDEPVHVKVSMYGTGPSTLEFFLEGQLAGSLPVSLNGFSSLRYTLSALTPGSQTLQAVLSSGTLSSTKETTFIYSSKLPDLNAYVYADQGIEQSNLRLIITVFNGGKSDAGATHIDLYDGMIVPDRLLTTFEVNPLSPKELQNFSYSLNCLGRAGTNTIYAVIDPTNAVSELNETNNESQIIFSLPVITLSTKLEKDIYSLGDAVTITSLITNLSEDISTDFIMVTTVNDSNGTQVFRNSEIIPSISGMATTSVNTFWPTDLNLQEGPYTIYQAIEGMDILAQKPITLKLDKDFMIASDYPLLQIEAGETAEFNLTFTPLRGFDGELSLSIHDCPQGFTASFTPNPVSLSDGTGQSLCKIIPTGRVMSGSYIIKVNASGGGRSHDLTLQLNLTDFEMIVTPITQSVTQLDEAIYTITLIPLNGFDSFISLEVEGVPKAMRAELSTNPVTLPRDVTLTLNTSKWLLPESYDIIIIARGRVVNHTTHATLIVEKNPLLTSGIVTAPGSMSNPIIQTFKFDGTLISEFEAFDSKSSVSIVTGDVDGDGIDEILTGTSWKLHERPALLGIYRKDGIPVALIETEHRSKFGLTLATGDIDRDWIEDIAVGSYTYPISKNDDREDDFDQSNNSLPNCHYLAGGYGEIRIYQVVDQRFIDTGVILYPYEAERYRGSPNIAFGDVDGDGVPELITAPGPDPCARAKIKVFKVETKDGVGRWKIISLLSEFTVIFGEKETGFGATIASGDIDGDGIAEIIVGAGPDPRNLSMVKVYRGDGRFTGVEFLAYPDSRKGKVSKLKIDTKNRFGVYVAVGDMESDGTSEIITGMGPGPMNDGWVRIFRGDGTPMGNGFLVYPKNTKNMKFGVKVSSGNVGE